MAVLDVKTKEIREIEICIIRIVLLEEKSRKEIWKKSW